MNRLVHLAWVHLLAVNRRKRCVRFLLIVCALLASARLELWGKVETGVPNQREATSAAVNATKASSAATPAESPTWNDWGKKKTETSGLNLSAGLDEVVKMVKAGVEPEVIRTFVDNSLVAYHPTADEILYLREQGVSGEIITALIRHGTQMREKEALAYKESQSRAPQSAGPTIVRAPEQAVDYSAAVQPAYPNYVYSYPRYVYVGYPSYTYTAPYYYGYPSYGYYGASYNNCGYPSYGYYGASYNFWPSYSSCHFRPHGYFPRSHFGLGFSYASGYRGGFGHSFWHGGRAGGRCR